MNAGLNAAMKHYRHLRKRDRVKLSRYRSFGWSYSKIAQKLGVNKATISREVRRNGEVRNRDVRFWKKLFLDLGLTEEYERIKDEPDSEQFLHYQVKYAERNAQSRKVLATSRQRVNQETKTWIMEKLKSGWTPEQIAGRSKTEQKHPVSHEFVYRLIIKDKKSGGKLYRLLPRFGKRKKRTSERCYDREPIPNRRGIEERPKVVGKRARMGDLEGDLIVGSNHKSYLLTVVDRMSRQVAIEYLPRRDQQTVLNAFVRAISRMPKAQTLTLDNAREFSCHETLTKLTGVRVYFSNPYASHERGSIENMNGRIRRRYPKKTDFRRIKPNKLTQLEVHLNSTPRKVLGYLTAYEFIVKQGL